jgi:hypothetical protein
MYIGLENVQKETKTNRKRTNKTDKKFVPGENSEKNFQKNKNNQPKKFRPRNISALRKTKSGQIIPRLAPC